MFVRLRSRAQAQGRSGWGDDSGLLFMIVLRHVNLSSHAAPDYRRSPGGRAARSPPLMLKPPKTIVLVGLMGAGKTSIGRRLAARLGLPFVDADSEIEVAAGRTI